MSQKAQADQQPEYVRLTSSSEEGLEQQVGERIADGWKTTGGVTLDDDPSSGAALFIREMLRV